MAAVAGSNAQTPLFGVIASGRPVITSLDCTQVSETKWVAPLVAPTVVPELTFFLLPSFVQAAQAGFGASLHFSTDNGANWQFIGAVHGEKPSDIFRTAWPGNSDLQGVHTVQIGVSVEPLSDIATNAGGSREVAGRLQFAKGIAMDLFTFMESFNTAEHGNEYLVLPTNCLEKWLARFENKYRRDPDFFMKSNN